MAEDKFSSAYGFGAGMQLGGTIAGAFTEAAAIKQRAQFQTQQLEFNMKIADIQAKDAIDQGEQDAKALKRKAEQLRGSQRAAIGASGIEVNSGSALSVQSDTEDMADLDANTIRLNAARRAWGFKAEGANLFSQNVLNKASAENQARSTLLTGGISALGQGAMNYATLKKLS